ncbi:hypothetical protein [Curtobacterium sp. NPDC092190]|uniref:hypothetical protein n=1 Tax=Curtobacterium sp. NPDC092190 TaxID=3363973 RepID=UPI0037FD723C
METGDQAQAEEAPPGWVLRTPTRTYEVWALPLVAVAVAAFVMVAGIAAGDLLARVVWTTAAVVVTTGAVALASAGWRAYGEQTRGASWDLHRTTVVTGGASGAAVLVASMIGGGTVGVAAGALGGLPIMMWSARSLTRFDRLAVSVTCAVVAAVSLVLVVVGLTAGAVPEWRVTVWTRVVPLIGVFTAVVAILQSRAVARAALE